MTWSQSCKEKEEHIAITRHGQEKGLWCEHNNLFEDQVQSSMSTCSKMEKSARNLFSNKLEMAAGQVVQQIKLYRAVEEDCSNCILRASARRQTSMRLHSHWQTQTVVTLVIHLFGQLTLQPKHFDFNLFLVLFSLVFHYHMYLRNRPLHSAQYQSATILSFFKYLLI